VNAGARHADATRASPSRIAIAAAAYFGIVFAVGFVLGTLRVTVLVPKLGELVAVACELPLMLAASWWAAGYVLRRWPLPARPGPRLTMGLLALALLLTAELALDMVLGGKSSAEHFARYANLPEQLGLAAQLLFALMPWLRR
jgi:hypothetical protein